MGLLNKFVLCPAGAPFISRTGTPPSRLIGNAAALRRSSGAFAAENSPFAAQSAPFVAESAHFVSQAHRRTPPAAPCGHLARAQVRNISRFGDAIPCCHMPYARMASFRKKASSSRAWSSQRELPRRLGGLRTPRRPDSFRKKTWSVAFALRTPRRPGLLRTPSGPIKHRKRCVRPRRKHIASPVYIHQLPAPVNPAGQKSRQLSHPSTEIDMASGLRDKAFQRDQHLSSSSALPADDPDQEGDQEPADARENQSGHASCSARKHTFQVQ